MFSTLALKDNGFVSHCNSEAEQQLHIRCMQLQQLEEVCTALLHHRTETKPIGSSHHNSYQSESCVKAQHRGFPTPSIQNLMRNWRHLVA